MFGNRVLKIFAALNLLWASQANAMACMKYYINGSPTEVEAGPIDAIHTFEQTGNNETDRVILSNYSETRDRVSAKYDKMIGKDGWEAVPEKQRWTPLEEYFGNKTITGCYMTGNAAGMRIVEFTGQVLGLYLETAVGDPGPLQMALVRRNGVTEVIPFYALDRLLIK